MSRSDRAGVTSAVVSISECFLSEGLNPYYHDSAAAGVRYGALRIACVLTSMEKAVQKPLVQRRV